MPIGRQIVFRSCASMEHVSTDREKWCGVTIRPRACLPLTICADANKTIHTDSTKTIHSDSKTIHSGSKTIHTGSKTIHTDSTKTIHTDSNLQTFLTTFLPLTILSFMVLSPILLLGISCPALADEQAQVVPRQAQSPSGKLPSPKEMKSKSGKNIDQMRKALAVILSRLEEARASKDAVKMNCVNDRLTDVKGMLRISEQADVALQEALANSEISQASHYFSVVDANARKVNQLAAECDQCIGMLAYDTQGVKLTIEEPPEVNNWNPEQEFGFLLSPTSDAIVDTSIDPAFPSSSSSSTSSSGASRVTFNSTRPIMVSPID